MISAGIVILIAWALFLCAAFVPIKPERSIRRRPF